MNNDCPSGVSRPADACGVLLAMALPTLVTWLYFVALNGYPAAIQQTAYGVGKTLQFALPLVWVLAVQRRRLRPGRPVAAGVGTGIAFGMAAFVVTMLLYHAWLKPAGYLEPAAEAVKLKLSGFGAGSPAGYLVLAVFYSLVHSFMEEYYWRWFVFGQLKRLISLWPAVVISSLAFMAHHVLLLAFYFGWFSAATVVFSLAVAVGGAVWAWLYHRSGSLYGPWLSHLLVDAAIFAVGFDMARALW